MTYTILNERAVIKITGEDKFKFLQGLITNNVNNLSKEKAIYACMLTAQGKYFSDLFLYLNHDNIIGDIPQTRANEIIQKLNLYKLRSKVTINLCPEYKVISFLNEPISSINELIVFSDPRNNSLGYRSYIQNNIIIEKLTPDKYAYNLARIENFIPEGDQDLIPEQSFILEYGFDQLNAIDYTKGCYVGQELVARTHYNGVIRKEIVQLEGINELPKLGSIVYSGEKKLGIICSSVFNNALALIRVADYNNLAPNAEIFVDNQKVRLIFKVKEND